MQPQVQKKSSVHLPSSLRLPWMGTGHSPRSPPGTSPKQSLGQSVGLSRNRMVLLREATGPAFLEPRGEVPFLGASGHPARARWLPAPSVPRGSAVTAPPGDFSSHNCLQ